MTSSAAHAQRALVALVGLLGLGVAALVPVTASSVAAGLLAAILAVVVASVACRAPLGAESLAGARARAVVTRLVPLSAQSDPDAPGHARPRAPGAFLPAA